MEKPISWQKVKDLTSKQNAPKSRNIDPGLINPSYFLGGGGPSKSEGPLKPGQPQTKGKGRLAKKANLNFLLATKLVQIQQVESPKRNSGSEKYPLILSAFV